MNSTVPLSTRRIGHLDAIVVTVLEANYSSTSVDGLLSLELALADVVANTESMNVILDLSAIEISGSSFLTCLDAFDRKLSANGRRLVVCGDQTGLISLVNWSDRMHYQIDLIGALNQCARRDVQRVSA